MKRFISEKAMNLSQSEIRKMFNIAAAMEDVISLGIGEPDFDTPPHVTEAAFKAAREGATHYTANAGYLHVRTAIAEVAERDYGIKCEPDKEVVITAGAMGALYLGMAATLNPGDEVLVQDPAWPNHFSQIRLVGAVPVPVEVKEENGFRLQAADLEKHISSKTRAILINTPNNPTGGVMTREELQAVAHVVKKYDLLVYSDEVYDRLVFGDTEHVSLASLPGMAERVITINSFSKTYAMTGWRVGYAIANEDIISSMVRLQENVVACVSSMGQHAALAAATGPQDFVHMARESYAKRTRLILDAIREIPGMSCAEPQGTIYLFPSIKDLGMSSAEAAHLFLTRGRVVTIPGTGFGKAGEGYLRLSCANSEDKIIEAMERIRRVVIDL